MDTEQLKLILELIRGAGEGTKDVAMIYLLVTIVNPLLVTFGLIACAAIICNTIRKCYLASNETLEAWKRIAAAAGEYPTNFPVDHEVQRVIDKLKK